MNENDTTTSDSTVNPPDPQMGLDEFCMRLSQSDRRVELIAGFHYVEAAAGRGRDTEAAYQSRFAAFINKPV